LPGVSDLEAKVYFEKVPLLPNLECYIEQGCATGGGKRNWESYGYKVEVQDEFERIVLSDPQTNGGLLVAVAPDEVASFEALVREIGFGDSMNLIGQLGERTTKQRHVSVA